MLHNRYSRPKGTRDTVQDTARLDLHVLSGAGFGISRLFNEGVQKLPAGHTMTYHDALLLISRNITILSLLPTGILTSPIFFKKLRGVGQAAKEFKQYMKRMVDNERNMTGDSGDSNLLSALIQASDEAEHAKWLLKFLTSKKVQLGEAMSPRFSVRKMSCGHGMSCLPLVLTNNL